MRLAAALAGVPRRRKEDLANEALSRNRENGDGENRHISEIMPKRLTSAAAAPVV